MIVDNFAQPLMKNSIPLLILTNINIIISIRIGSIQNTLFVASVINKISMNITCHQCTCFGIENFAIGWNCIKSNSTCQLIQNYLTTDNGLVSQNNTTFSFIISPSHLHSTTTTTTHPTTTLPCSKSGRGNIAILSYSNPFPWTQYTYNYTATKTTSTIVFGVDGINEQSVFLDDISIVDTINPSVSLLRNPSFENSSTELTGWNVWCSAICGSGSAGTITSGSKCRSSGNCYKGQCRSGGIYFLVQTFPTVLAHTYNILFWYQQVRLNSGGGSVELYVDII